MAEFRRSRLVRKTDEQITKKTVSLGIFTIILFIAIVVFGLPFLVRFSVFLGQSKSNKDSNTKETVLPPLPPRLVIPFEATNSGRIDISGFAEANVTVELMKNDISFGKTQVSDSGDFSFTGVDLNNGENTFSAITMTEKGGSSQASKISNVFFTNKAPQLVMSNPSEETITVDSVDFDIIGKSDKDVSVLINNRVAMVDDQGQFKLKIQLVAGKNDIQIIVRDSAGNETKKNITINCNI
jgi:hypothetical protein